MKIDKQYSYFTAGEIKHVMYFFPQITCGTYTEYKHKSFMFNIRFLKYEIGFKISYE